MIVIKNCEGSEVDREGKPLLLFLIEKASGWLHQGQSVRGQPRRRPSISIYICRRSSKVGVCLLLKALVGASKEGQGGGK